MAMRLTADATADPPEPILGILTRLKGVATGLIDSRCADVPDDSRNEAIIRLAAYIYDMPTSPMGSGYVTAWHYSGCGAILAPWRAMKTGITV